MPAATNAIKVPLELDPSPFVATLRAAANALNAAADSIELEVGLEGLNDPVD